MKIIFLILLFSLNIFAKVDFPINWKTYGYFNQFMPKTYELFENGAIISTIDVVKVTKKEYTFNYYMGAGLYITMGYQYEDVVFDPRDSHYSLITGGLWDFNKFNLDIGLLHDCFHDIDRHIGDTEIWNVIYAGTYTLDYTKMRENRDKNIKKYLKNRPYYSFYLWYFPYWSVYDWMQNVHNFLYSIKTEIDYPIIKQKRFDFSLYSKLHYFYDKSKKITHDNCIGTKLRYIGDGGIVEFLVGYVSDNQNIKPKHDKFTIGLNFFY